MANPNKGEISFEVGNVFYTLVYDFDTLVELEQAFKMGMIRIIKLISDPDTATMQDMRKFLCIGLKRKHPTIDEHQTGQLIDGYGVFKITRLFEEIVQKTFGDPDKKPDNPQLPIQMTGTTGSGII